MSPPDPAKNPGIPVYRHYGCVCGWWTTAKPLLDQHVGGCRKVKAGRNGAGGHGERQPPSTLNSRF